MLILINTSALIVAITLRFARLASTGLLFGAFILLYLLQVGCLAIGGTSRAFTIRGRRQNYFGVTGVEPILLPYLVASTNDCGAEERR